jgi:hypothetical protein
VGASSDDDPHGCRPAFPKKDTDDASVSVLVFDLVLHQGQWKEGKKHGRCKHFLCYRNFYLPDLAQNTDAANGKSQIPKSLKMSFLSARAGRTTIDEILKSAQFLSGSFFSGQFHEDNLFSGSLFYFHRRFCLLFENNSDHEAEEDKRSKWLQGHVTYVDCCSGSSFSELWEQCTNLALLQNVWGMGCNMETRECFYRSKHRVAAPIEYRNSAAHLDVKDGLAGRMMRVFRVRFAACARLLLLASSVFIVFIQHALFSYSNRRTPPFTFAIPASVATMRATRRRCSLCLIGRTLSKFGRSCGRHTPQKKSSQKKGSLLRPCI